VMLRALDRLGAGVDLEASGDVTICGARGEGRSLRGGVGLHLGNAGTATRFLTAACALANGPVTIDGDPRMRERPIGELVGFLRELGVTISELLRPGYPPIRIEGTGRVAGGEIEIPTTLSSQFVSALIMISPHTRDGITLKFSGDVTSRAYITMTLELMRRTIGYRWEGSIESGSLVLPPMEDVSGFSLDVEPDASGATYFFGAAALFEGARVTIPISKGESLQSDARFVDVLARMGADVQERDGETDRKSVV